jgi:hypothetical protein
VSMRSLLAHAVRASLTLPPQGGLSDALTGDGRQPSSPDVRSGVGAGRSSRLACPNGCQRFVLLRSSTEPLAPRRLFHRSRDLGDRRPVCRAERIRGFSRGQCRGAH